MNYTNYGFPQYQQPQFQRPVQMLRIFPVSNIMEANSTPVDGFEPIFFYNRAENVIYMKQMLADCSAPIQIFKLQPSEQPLTNEKDKKDINIYADNFKAINERLDGLYNLLKPMEIPKKEKGSKEQ